MEVFHRSGCTLIYILVVFLTVHIFCAKASRPCSLSLLVWLVQGHCIRTPCMQMSNYYHNIILMIYHFLRCGVSQANPKESMQPTIQRLLWIDNCDPYWLLFLWAVWPSIMNESRKTHSKKWWIQDNATNYLGAACVSHQSCNVLTISGAAPSSSNIRENIVSHLQPPLRALPLAHFFLRDLPPAMAAFILASLDFCTLQKKIAQLIQMKS